MKFKLDENLPLEVTVVLLQAGHDALTVVDQDLVGESDDEILKICQSEGRIVVTMDLDFSNIHRYPPQQSPGIIVLRLASQELMHMMTVVQTMVVPLLEKQSPVGCLWVVDEDRVRVRSGEGLVRRPSLPRRSHKKPRSH
jgi:predicted nuclease of predicted toxin-antitoxin system